MSLTLLIGEKGRMSLALQDVLKSRSKNFLLVGDAKKTPQIDSSSKVEGIIDFSAPEAAPDVVTLALHFKAPLVCGTTGWKSANSIQETFSLASRTLPIVWDSNYSLGVELLCQAAETVAKQGPQSILIEDIHHIHKKDAPSGTALKIEKRIREVAPNLPLTIDSKREGEVFGIHRVKFRFSAESLEFSHEAASRQIFAEGALAALEWLKNQKPGLYSMRDVLKES